MSKLQKISEMAVELERASELEGSELGEWWGSLARMVPRYIDCASEEFKLAFESEIKMEYARFKEEFRVVETIETRTEKRIELLHVSELDD
jgi:hypothetical protein